MRTSCSSLAGPSERHLEPAAIDGRAVRRFAASLSERGHAPATIARKLAALRGLFQADIERGGRADNPAELISTPKRPQRLPHVLKAADVAALLDRITADSPLEVRDRAMFELAYGCGLRAQELVSLALHSIDFDAELVRVEGKGGKTRLVPAGEFALRALERYLARARPALRGSHPGRWRRPPVHFQIRTRAPDLGCQAPPAPVGTQGGRRRRRWLEPRGHPPPRPAPLLRHPPARGRSRPACDPGAARTQHHLHDAGLHSRGVGAAEVGVCARPPSGMSLVLAGSRNA